MSDSDSIVSYNSILLDVSIVTSQQQCCVSVLLLVALCVCVVYSGGFLGGYLP